jgi:acyl-homoserine lactone acylase PvdQ
MSSRMNAANARTIAFKWVSTDPTIPDKSISSFLKINLAHNYNDYRNALKEYVAPAQNFIFADVDGNIGYQMPGKVPRRANGHTGKRPISGDGRFAWQTTTTTSSRDGTTTTATSSIDFDHMPRAYNPPKDFLPRQTIVLCHPCPVLPVKTPLQSKATCCRTIGTAATWVTAVAASHE